VNPGSRGSKTTHSTATNSRRTEAALHIDGADPSRDFSLADSNLQASN